MIPALLMRMSGGPQRLSAVSTISRRRASAFRGLAGLLSGQ